MILDKQYQMAQKLFRQFAETEFTKEALDALEETGEFNWDMFKKMASYGFMGVKTPVEYGGQGGDSIAYALMIEEFARVSPVLSLYANTSNSLGAGPLLSAVFALVPDVVEYGNWKFDIRSEGLISSAQSIGSKIGIGLGSALTGWILAAVGYSGGPDALITDAIVNAVKFDYTWLGAILGVVIFIIVLLLNVEKYAPEYQKASGMPPMK